MDLPLDRVVTGFTPMKSTILVSKPNGVMEPFFEMRDQSHGQENQKIPLSQERGKALALCQSGEGEYR